MEEGVLAPALALEAGIAYAGIANGMDNWDKFQSAPGGKGGKEIPKTNKETDQAAKNLGYEKTNEKSHGKTIYKNPKGKSPKYITQDVDSHNGGIWKGAETVKELGKKSTRTGTYDGELNRTGD